MEQQAKEKNTYKFRLSSKDVESGLKLHVDDLASRRVLTDEIKTALTLLAQLKAGNRELLDSMFPNICAASQPPPSGSDDMEKLADMVAARVKAEMPKLNGSDIPDIRQNGFPAMKPAGYAPSIAAPAAVASVAKPKSADEIASDFLNFLQ